MNNNVDYSQIIQKMLVTTGTFVGTGILVGFMIQYCSTPLQHFLNNIFHVSQTVTKRA